jgi:thiamine-phosphate pyrophosphorylase
MNPMLRYAITDRSQLHPAAPGASAQAHLATSNEIPAEIPDEIPAETRLLLALLDHTAHWARQRVDYIQIREKDLPAATLLTLARRMRSLVRDSGSPTRLLLNGRPDIALAAGLDGVHLPSGREALTPTQIRALFPSHPPPIVSVSCHTLEEVEAAASVADLILFGPVFGKTIPSHLAGLAGHQTTLPGTGLDTTLPGVGLATTLPGVGLEALRAACTLARGTPVLALGGITLQNTPGCLQAGAAGIAAIRLFLT